MMGSGWTINVMAMESISIKVEPNMKVFGRIMNRMEVELKHGLIKTDLKVIIGMATNKAKESSDGMMVVVTMEILSRI